MTTFILIHGSWHSSWNWHKVVPILEKKGHKVLAIDLLGMGRDKTPIKEITFKSTVEQICNLIDSIDGKVVLVGHSKNGIMISQAAEYRPEKIEKLIYLAAYLIPNGKTQVDYSSQDANGVLKPYVTRYPEANSHTLQHEIYKKGLYHDCDDDIYQMAKMILSHESALTGITPLEQMKILEASRDIILNVQRTKQLLPLFSKKCTMKLFVKRFIKCKPAIRPFLANHKNCVIYSWK